MLLQCIHNVADAIAAMPEMQESSVLSGQHTAIIRQLLDTSERYARQPQHVFIH